MRISRHFDNRLFDRDTLLLSHFDVNFLFVLALYARNNNASKDAWRKYARAEIRKAVRKMLWKHFEFYTLHALQNVDAEAYFRTHFQDILGKIFNIGNEDQKIYLLALDKSYDNKSIKAALGENFRLEPVELGEEL